MDNLQFRRMKNMVKSAYPTSTWAEKVDNMHNDQIAAIYFSLKERGAFDKRKKQAKRNEIVQLTIEDCFPEVGTIEVRCIPDINKKEVNDIRRSLHSIIEYYDNQVANYILAPDKYVKPDWDFVNSLFKERGIKNV